MTFLLACFLHSHTGLFLISTYQSSVLLCVHTSYVNVVGTRLAISANTRRLRGNSCAERGRIICRAAYSSLFYNQYLENYYIGNIAKRYIYDKAYPSASICCLLHLYFHTLCSIVCIYFFVRKICNHKFLKDSFVTRHLLPPRPRLYPSLIPSRAVSRSMRVCDVSLSE